MLKVREIPRFQCKWVDDEDLPCRAPATYELHKAELSADLDSPGSLHGRYCGRHIHQAERLLRTIERQQKGR